MAGVNGGKLTKGDFIGEGTIVITASMDPQAKKAITDFLGSLNQIVKGDKLGQYFDNLSNVSSKFLASLQRFKKESGNVDFAKSLVNDFNALEGIAQADGKKLQDVLKGVAGGYDNVMQSVIRAREVAGSSSFDGITAKAVQDFVTSGRVIEEWGADVNRIIEGVTLNTSTEELQRRIRELNETLAASNTEKDKAAAASERYKKAAEQAAESERRLKEQYNEKFHGDEYQELVNKAEKYNEVVQRNVEEVQRFIEISKLGTFSQWGGLDQSVDYDGISAILDSVERGSMTASEAIVRLKEEYGSLIDLSNTRDIGESKITHLESAIQETVSIVRELKDSVGNAGFGSSDGQTILDRALGNSEEIRGDTESLRAAQNVVVNLLNSLVDNGGGMETERTAISGLVTTLKELASVDVQGLTLTSDILRRLPNMANVKVNTDQMDNLIRALKSLVQLSKDMDFTALTTLTNVNLSGFSELSVSKASLSNLATYLPVITGSGVDIDKLRALSQISLSNLNKENLSVSKASFEHLRELIQTIQGVSTTEVSASKLPGMENVAQAIDQVTQKVTQEKEVFREADDVLKQHVVSEEAAAQAEAEKKKISELLATALEREEERTKSAGKAAQDHANLIKKQENAMWDAYRAEQGMHDKSASQVDAEVEREIAAYNKRKDAEQAAAEKAQKAWEKEEAAAIASADRKADAEERASERKVKAAEKAAAAAAAEEKKAADAAQRATYNDARRAVNQYYGLLMSKDTSAAKREDVVMTEAGWASQSGKYAELAQQLNAAKTAYDLYTSAQKESMMSGSQVAALNELNATRQKEYALAVENTAARETEHAQKAEELAQKKREEAEATQAAREAKRQEAEATKAQAQAERDAARKAKEATAEEDKKTALLKRLNGLYSQCTTALQKYALAARLAGNKEAYDGIKSTRDAVAGLIKELETANPNIGKVAKGVQDADLKFSTFSKTLKTNGGVLNSWLTSGTSQLKSRLQYSLGLAAMVYKAVGEIKKMISTAVELDTAMNQLQIVTRASGSDMEEYGKRVSSMAKETAQATKDLIDATTVYARLGYSMDESATLSKYTAMLQGVGDIDPSAAQDAMTAIIKAFGKNVDDIEDVMDKLVTVGNNFPISVSQLAEGMNNAGSMLSVAGNSFEQSIALLTAANTTIQNISKASTGLRTIAARIRKTKVEGDEDGELVEEAKYQEMVNALTKQHVSLVDEVTGEYRSTYDIIRDIAGVWGKMTSMEQAAVVEALAGTRQQNIFASLMTQFGEAEEAMSKMGNSAGELQESYDIYLNSIQAHVQTLKATFDEFSMKVVNGDFAKGVVDILTKSIEGVSKLIDLIGIGGLLGGLLAVVEVVRILNGVSLLNLLLPANALAALIPALTGPGLLATIGAIAAMVTIVTGAVRLYKELNPTLEDLKKESQEAEDNLNKMKSAIDANAKAIENLQAKVNSGDATIAEQQELERLQSQNEEYRAQLKLLEEISKYKKQEVAQSTNQSVNKFFSTERSRVVAVGLDNEEYIETAVGGYGGLLNAIDNYNRSLEREAELQEQIASFVGTDKEAERLLKQRSDASVATREYLEQLYAFRTELNGYLDDLYATNDEESIKNMGRLERALEEIARATGDTEYATNRFKKNLEKLDSTVRTKLSKGIKTLSNDELRVLADWMRRCGYDAETLGRIMSQMNEEVSKATQDSGDKDGENALESQILKWGTMADEIERAKDAVESYNKALEGGNNGDTAAQMQDAWKKGMEEIDAGRKDSRAAWALYEMVFSPEQIDAMGRDAYQLAQAVQSEFFRGIFDDNNAENGYEDADNQLGYGKRLLLQLEQMQDQLSGVQVWRDADGGLHYIIDDFSDLAVQLGKSEGLIDALLDDLDAYGAQLLTDTTQNTDLIKRFQEIAATAENAKEAVKQFYREAFDEAKKEGREVNENELLRMTDSIHDLGYLSLDKDSYRGLLEEVKQEMSDAENAAKKDGIHTDMHADGDQIEDETIKILNYLQNLCNANPILVSFESDPSNIKLPGQDEDNNNNKNNNNNNNGKISNKPHKPEEQAAGGKLPGTGGGPTLVNELGPELISDNGRAFIANNGKPGFVTLSRDAIVFTADETQDILHGKKTVNAKAHAQGTRAGLRERLLSGKGVPARGWWTCPNCHASNSTVTNTCTKCGYSRVTGTVPTPRPVTQPTSPTVSGNYTRPTTPTTPSSPFAGDYTKTPTYPEPTAESVSRPYNDPNKVVVTVSVKRCPRCGSSVAKGVQLCPYCGYNFVTGGTSTTGTKTYVTDKNTGVTKSVIRGNGYWTTRSTMPITRVPSEQDGGDGDSNGSNKYTGSGGGYNVGGSDYNSQADPTKVDWIAVRLNRLARAIADLEKIASSGFKKLDTRLTAAKNQIKKTTEQISTMENAYHRYLAEADKIGLDESIAYKVREGTINIEEYDEETRKKIDQYTEWYEKAIDAQSAVEELHQQIAQLYLDSFQMVQTDFENQMSEIEHKANMAQKDLQMAQTKGYMDSAKFYEDQADIEKSRQDKLNAELQELKRKQKEAMDSGEIAEGSEAWYEMQKAIREVEEAIADSNIKLVEFQKAVRNLEWTQFDYAQERFSQLTKEANFFVELMSHHDLFNEQGKFNELGEATAGMHALNYDVYMAQADEYAKQIQKIQRDLEKDPYDTELIARRETLIGLQQQSILAAEQEKEAVKSLVQEGINIELDSLKDLIDAYEKSLDSAKNLYEYQKKISEKTADIASIQKQLSAYANDTSEETRAKVQKLTNDLNRAQTDLQETERDQSISDQKKLLSDVYDEYEEYLNQRLDNIDQLMQDIVTGTNENMDSIRNTLIETGAQVGYTLTDQFQKAMSNDLGYYDHVFDGINSVHVILTNIYDTVAAMARASGAVKAYATGGLVDYTGLAAVHGSKGRPELMLNASDTENFLEAAKMLRGAATMPDITSLPNFANGISGLNIGQIMLNIPIDHVQDYNDFVTQLQSDTKFERLISAMTLDRMAGKSVLGKNRIVFN